MDKWFKVLVQGGICINSKLLTKIIIDIGMTFLLLFLMTYELIGQATHEWIGIFIFVLFVTHHILNCRWSRNLVKRKYTLHRIILTLFAFVVFIFMIGSMISGIVLSRHVFPFISITGGLSLVRKIHMISAYWGFVLMSVHLGFHWNMIMAVARKMVKGKFKINIWVLRIIAFIIAGLGISAFIKRQIGSYMLLKNQFVFFNFYEPLALFLIDYIAVMGLFVLIGHYLSKVCFHAQ